MEKLSDGIELANTREGAVTLYGVLKKYSIEYITSDEQGNKRFWESDILPEELSDDKRIEILDSCLGRGNYTSDEKVNMKDLFMHKEFISEVLSLTL